MPRVRAIRASACCASRLSLHCWKQREVVVDFLAVPRGASLPTTPAARSPSGRGTALKTSCSSSVDTWGGGRTMGQGAGAPCLLAGAERSGQGGKLPRDRDVQSAQSRGDRPPCLSVFVLGHCQCRGEADGRLGWTDASAS